MLVFGGLPCKRAVLALAIVGGGFACGKNGRGVSGTSQVARGQVPADSDRFPHDVHTSGSKRMTFKGRSLACTDCHPKAAVLRGGVSRPGKNQHEPCDSCHQKEFFKPPGAFCKNCHKSVSPRRKGMTKLWPYPERGFRRVLSSSFSHKFHTDADAMEKAVGFHVDCQECHTPNKRGEPTQPGHAQCVSCHQKRPSIRKKLGMGQCAGCHPKNQVDLVRGRIFITKDLTFSHKRHERDMAGDRVSCDTCHADIPSSRSASDVSVPRMRQCATCHENAQRSPDRVRMANCATCHAKISSGTPPANHMVGRSLPESHTLEFRQNHGEQARDQNANCAYCHDGMTGNVENSCFECHKVMRPMDHTVAWRDDAHGREAAGDSDRGQTCHDADYCVACHSVPPRSHQPYAEFRLGLHAEEARFNLRSCFACHTFESTCSDCHRSLR